MSEKYRVTPSELLGIKDSYTSYCLNEACFYISSRIEAGDEPIFEVKYNSFKDIYKDYIK